MQHPDFRSTLGRLRRGRLYSLLFFLVTCPLQTTAAGQQIASATGTDRTRQAPALSTQDGWPQLNIALARIEPGAFTMGSQDVRRLGQYAHSEAPPHTVRITRSFRISQFEITVGQFRMFVAATGYRTEAEQTGRGCNGLDPVTGRISRSPDRIWKSPGFPQTDRHPVICVSWQDAVSFCQWLSKTTGSRCRLPTEAEWEYCCRGGTTTQFSTGDRISSLQGRLNCADISLHRVFAGATSVASWDDGFAMTAPVGSFHPNAFGLYDMHGNVGEWCRDWFDAGYYAGSPPNDPTGPDRPTQWHVVRGGSWYNAPFSCRSSGRHDGIATEASTTNGFRIVVEDRP